MFKLIGALSLTPLQSNDIYVINLMVFKNQHDFAVSHKSFYLKYVIWISYFGWITFT